MIFNHTCADAGRIKPRRETGLKGPAQRRVARSIRSARQLALLNPCSRYPIVNFSEEMPEEEDWSSEEEDMEEEDMEDELEDLDEPDEQDEPVSEFSRASRVGRVRYSELGMADAPSAEDALESEEEDAEEALEDDQGLAEDQGATAQGDAPIKRDY